MIEYNFCPKCGTPILSDRKPPYCKHCGVTYYSNAKPCASVLPIKDGKVLLAKRGLEPYMGAYDIIGGFMEADELPEVAALREAKEETGLDMNIVSLLGIYNDRYGEGGDHTLNLHYIAEIVGGNMYALAKEAGFELNDYDHNSYELRDGKSIKKLNIVFEGGDTHPEHYAKLFSEDGKKSQKKALDLILGYDVIVIKSCYPNSHITTDDELKRIKKDYQSIANFFSAMPEKKLIILTSPPLMPLRTNKEAASRARKLATWLSETKLGTNTSIFNFFDLLAEPEDRKKPNVLRKKYRRLLPVDSHPNPKASKEIAPHLVAFLKKLTA